MEYERIHKVQVMFINFHPTSKNQRPISIFYEFSMFLLVKEQFFFLWVSFSVSRIDFTNGCCSLFYYLKNTGGWVVNFII